MLGAMVTREETETQLTEVRIMLRSSADKARQLNASEPEDILNSIVTAADLDDVDGVLEGLGQIRAWAEDGNVLNGQAPTADYRLMAGALARAAAFLAPSATAD